MIHHSEIKTLIACGDILDVVRMRLQSTVTLTYEDPASKLSMVIDALHQVISQIENVLEAQERHSK